MTLLSTAQNIARDTRRDPRSHLLPIVTAAIVAASAIGTVAYLLWPTWEVDFASGPSRLPVSIGNTLFNVPTAAIRMNIQRHSGPQERVDLSFSYPSLEPPEAPKRVSAANLDEAMQPTGRIFLSIAAHNDSLAPDMRTRTIYPRYLEQTSTLGENGLSMRAFREGSPYSNEDSVFFGCAEHHRALHAGWRHSRNVPERAARRWGRPHLPLSARLACAMARGRRCDGPPDPAGARAEGIEAGAPIPGKAVSYRVISRPGPDSAPVVQF